MPRTLHPGQTPQTEVGDAPDDNAEYTMPTDAYGLGPEGGLNEESHGELDHAGVTGVPAAGLDEEDHDGLDHAPVFPVTIAATDADEAHGGIHAEAEADADVIHEAVATGASGDATVAQVATATVGFATALMHAERDGVEAYLRFQVTSAGVEAVLVGLPTADPAVAGALWNDAGTLRLSGAAGLPGAFELPIDGGGVAITTGVKQDFIVPFACTLTGWTLLADQSGSIVLDVWRDTYANFPPTDADSLTNAHEPTLAAAVKAEDLDIADWTSVELLAGDVLRLNVDSAATIERALLVLYFTRD